MNAVCAGGAVAVVSALVWRFTEDWKSSVLAALVYALSWALLLHATNSAEPVVGLFASLVAGLVTAEGLLRQRFALLFVGGICLALALANYESMFLPAPLLYLCCLIWPGTVGAAGRHAWLAPPILRLLVSILGTIAGVVAIYGVAYHTLGIATLHGMLRAFFQIGGEPEVYAGIRFSKLANLPIGLVNNLIAFSPGDYHGLRSLLIARNVPLTVAVVFSCALLGSTLLPLARCVGQLSDSRRAIIFAAVCAAGLLFELLPLLYWDPMYDKLWLQPLALLAVLGGVLGGRMNAASARRFGAVVLAIIALEVTINVPRVVLADIQPTGCLDDASRIAGLISPRDKVVTDFDPVSSLWMALYDRNPLRTLVFPATAASTSLATLDRWAKVCEPSQCRLLFIGLLDQPRDAWDAFLEKRLKVHYDSLGRYRHSSQTIDKFSCEDGSLRAYEAPAMEVGVH
jgi:hypothetical protein